MCHHTYHHYPSCGHISNWSMTSCQEYTNKLLLAGPEHSAPCEVVHSSHDVLQSTQPPMCVQCESNWVYSITHGETQGPIESQFQLGYMIEINARMVSNFDTDSKGDADDRDVRSTDHSDNGQVLLRAIGGGDGDLGSSDHSDNGQDFLSAIACDEDANCSDHSDNEQVFSSAIHGLGICEDCSKRASWTFDFASNLDLEFVPVNNVESCEDSAYSEDQSVYYYSFYDDSVSSDEEDEDEDEDEEASCGSWDGDEEVSNPYLCPDMDWDSLNVETFGHHSSRHLAEIEIAQAEPEEAQTTETRDHLLQDEIPAKTQNCEDDPLDDLLEIRLISIQERIQATVRRRIEEENEKQQRQVNISRLLDAALLEKDKNDRREREAAQGIEEDPHLWDTESMEQFPAGPFEIYEDASDISPRSPVKAKSRSGSLGPQPRMHIYQGTMFAASEAQAHQKGLREIRPYLDHQGEWEGQMRAFSADDANEMGLLDPVHLRGCCDERPAERHAYWGLMHAESEYEAETRHLENIQRVPGFNNQFYGTIQAENLAHAREMGVSNPQHLWGCCKDGLVDMPLAVKHRYNGVMSAISQEDVENRGLLDAQPVSGEGNYFGGLYYGHVVVDCELEAWIMGLRKIEHDDGCCAAAEAEAGAGVAEAEAGADVGLDVDALLPNALYTFYGYMFADTEQDLVDRGLQSALLVPGYTQKYSGNLQAGSAEEANAMGLIGASRIEWSGDLL